MAAYFFVDIRKVIDERAMQEYRNRITANVEQFGGTYLVVGGDSEVVEGDWEPVFPVLVKFQSMEQAKLWYDSEEYRELKEMRLAATNSNGVFLEGIPVEPEHEC